MSDVIVDLAEARRRASFSMPLEHPAGVTLPFDGPADAALIDPETRGEIRSGAYNGDLLRLLPGAVKPGDRVLVLGAGLGVVSTLVARTAGVARVIAAESDTALFPYLARVHDLNGVCGVEIINAVLAVEGKGQIPFCAQRDPRASSPLPCDQSWPQAMTVPFMDLNLILAEERISLIVCDTPAASAQLLAQAALERVDRIVLNYGDDAARCWEGDGVYTQLVARGYYPEPSGTAILLRRSAARRSGPALAAEPANSNSAPLLPVWGGIDDRQSRI